MKSEQCEPVLLVLDRNDDEMDSRHHDLVRGEKMKYIQRQRGIGSRLGHTVIQVVLVAFAGLALPC